MDPSQCASRKRDRTNENFAKATKNLMWRCEKIRQCYGADVYIQVHRKHKHYEYSTSDEPSWPKSKTELWVLDFLAPKYGLSFEQTFVKREATAEDILRVLGGLWGKADNIPCAPATRVSFDWTLNLLGVTGFRISEVINIQYSQVELGVVRNPSDPTRTALVATIHLEHRKQKTNAVKGAQNHKLQFQVTMVPYRVICLTRKVIAQALSDGAFEAGYTTYDDLLKRPILENVDYVPLRWKATLSNKVMFPITRMNFWTLWRLAQQALGMRDCLNIHSIRVGTGKKLHGVFEPAFRNYILGNTTAVYEKSYIPQLISGKDLMTAAWGALAGNDESTAQLRHATSTRDEDAPMHPTIEDYEMIESREDIKTLRQNLKTMKEQHGSRSLEAKDAKSSLESSLTTLRKLAVADRRKRYFEEADRQRSLGVSTAPLRETAVFKHTASRYSRSVPHAVHIGQLMQRSERQDREFETAYFKSVIEFIAEIHTPTAGDAKGGGDSGAESKDQECMCLLCLQYFARRPGRTRHTNRAHKRTFDRKFQCLACVRERMGPVIITDKFHWSSHIAKQHGPLNAPNYVSTAPQGSARCLICDQRVSRHVYEFHQEQGLFDQPFPCPECLRLDESKIFINGLQEWRQHAKIHHSSATSTECVLDQDSCLMCGEQRAPAVANKQFNKRHKGIFERPFQCWTCSRTNQPHVDIGSQSDWYSHVERPGFEKEIEFVQETGNMTCASNKKHGRLESEGACLL
ncbi:hypothetical protein CcaCcLH18_07889 [Colletotrichum camelliae]|nr:hypothetical protein CcaCcLH18_07889 [Colletotrichum camelliae]